MRKLKVKFVLLIIYILSSGCSQENSVVITDESFKDLIEEFYLRSKRKMISVSDTVSVFIDPVESSESKAILKLYSSKRLKYEYYIGRTKISDLTVLVYSDDKITKSVLYKVQYKDSSDAGLKEQDFRNVYMEIWEFDKGTFTFSSFPE